MNFKKSALASAITLATFATGAAAFDASSWEVSGFVKNETAALQKDGTFHGQRTSMTDTGDKNDSGDVIKFENTAKLFVNGDLTENAALHAELNFVYDTEATPNDYQGHMNYSQNDYLRELYVDTMVGDTEVRVGKQQVVWGTADGIKLLDIINPTDYREFAQNTMEDSRIPVWMIKADSYVGDTGSLQFIVSQREENKIAGLNGSGDQGNPYIMKGVDTITGKVNGFLNISPALAKVADTFDTAAQAGLFSDFYTPTTDGLTRFTNFTTDYFARTKWQMPAGFGGSSLGGLVYATNGSTTYDSSDYISATSTSTTISDRDNATGFALLNMFANTDVSGASGMSGATGNSNAYVTNLVDTNSTTVKWDISNPTSAFEYMPNSTFGTFNTFSDNLNHGSMTTSYVKSYPSDASANAGFRFKDSTASGLNYSVNYFYHYDANPYVDISYHDASSGEELTTELRGYTGSVVARDSSYLNSAATAGGTTTTTTVLLKNSAGAYYGSVAPNVSGASLSSNGVDMRYTERLNRIHSLGGSFDYTIDTETLPVVLRGEFLYDKDVMAPVVDRRLLSIGDLEGALTPQKADYFKYVIGADVTLLTNMLASAQFIQFRNLDYVDESQTCTTQLQQSFACNKYTADAAVMSLGNGLQKARENKEFYSLFFSKPFGANQLGRWNNIFMFEEGGGKWNRFDVEYSFSDELVGSFELNNYWGDANTQFGQMEDSSNIQVGLKYLF
jgi:hypothetical protein